MNKYIKIVLILLLLISSFYVLLRRISRIEVVNYYSNGKCKSVFYSTMFGDKLCGNEFYESGAIKFSYCKYPKIGINGTVREYYETGELFTEVIFANGKRNGIEKTFSKDGILIQLLPFVNGKMQGWAYKYNLDGSVKNEKYFFEDSMYYLKLYKTKDKINYLDQICPKFSIDKKDYHKGDTLNFTVIFKSDKLFPYNRNDILLYFDIQKTNGPKDNKVNYERYFVNLSQDTIREQLIFMDGGDYIFYTNVIHKEKPPTFVNFEYNRSFYVSK